MAEWRWDRNTSVYWEAQCDNNRKARRSEELAVLCAQAGGLRGYIIVVFSGGCGWTLYTLGTG